MKKELIFSSIITVILIIGVLIWNQQPTQTITTTGNTTTTQSSNTALITSAEVAKHATAVDCWIIINKNAYNVTTYLDTHEGGSETIIPTCGTDATDAYDAIKEGRGHSTKAAEDLSTLLVGAVQ
ncbi:MAG: cytochrome b5 domain-containing protein [Microgenomates group bacterium]